MSSNAVPSLAVRPIVAATPTRAIHATAQPATAASGPAAPITAWPSQICTPRENAAITRPRSRRPAYGLHPAGVISVAGSISHSTSGSSTSTSAGARFSSSSAA